MNRRSFIKGLVSSFIILPSATTYERKWVKQQNDLWIPNPNWVNAQYEISWIGATIVGIEYTPKFKLFEVLAEKIAWKPDQTIMT